MVGAACSIAGYLTEDALLSTIGSVMLGFAGGFADGVFGMAPGMGAGLMIAAESYLSSPLSPLSPKAARDPGLGARPSRA